MLNRSRPDVPCPLCGKLAAGADAPFCSPGCRDRDLLAWLGDGYRIPLTEVASDGLDSAPEPPL